MAMTEAMATRFFSPPESEYGGRSRSFSMRRCSATSCTRRRTSSSGRPSCSGPKASSSRTLAQNSCTSASWKTKPTRERKSRRNDGVLERVLRERRAEGEDLSLRREDEAVEHLEQRGLAGAVGADDGDVLAGLDREVDPRERRPAGAVRVADRAQDEVRRRHSLTIRSAASATAHSATLAVSHSQSPGPIRSRRSDGIAPV